MKRSAPARPARVVSAALALLAVACSDAEPRLPETWLDAAAGPSLDASTITMGDAADLGPPPPDATVTVDALSLADVSAPPPDAGATLPDAATIPPPDPDAGSTVDAAPAPLADASDPTADAAPPPVPAGCAPAADPRPGQVRLEDGRFVRFPAFESAFVGPRRVTVRQPPPGGPPDERLAVLYMHDGQNVFFDEEAAFGVSWGAIDTTDAFAAAPDGRRLLVVAVDNTAARIDDYTPVVDPEYDDGGDADAYGRFLVEELKPFVDFHFPTRCEPEQTAVAGSSLGGLVSLYLGAQYPDVFGRIGAFSPSLWWADGVAFEWSAPLAAGPARSPGRALYLDTGNFEGSPAVGPGAAGRSTVVVNGRSFVEDVVAALAPLERDRVRLVEDPGAAHDEAAWRRRLPDALALLWRDGPPAAPAVSESLWPWATVLRPGGSTTTTIFARDALGRPFVRLGDDGAVTSADPAIARIDPAGVVTAIAAGTSTLRAAADPADPTARLTVAAAAETILRLRVTVPLETEAVFVGGSAETLGPWVGDALPLRRLRDGLFEGAFVVPTGDAVEYKYTLGDWDRVEKAADGSERANRRHTAAADVLLEDTVLRWAPGN
jgi:predicted alpha/beta superfamily hydrolase